MSFLIRKPKKYEILENGNYSSLKNEISSLENENTFITHVKKITSLSDFIFSYKIIIDDDLISLDEYGITNKIRIGQIGIFLQNDFPTDTNKSPYKENYNSKIKVINVYLINNETVIDVIADKNISVTDNNEYCKIIWDSTIKQSDKIKQKYPKNIYVSEISDDLNDKKNITIKWDDVKFATGFGICYRKHQTTTNYEWKYIYDIKNTNYKLNELEKNCTYSICVMSFFDKDISYFSKEIEFST